MSTATPVLAPVPAPPRSDRLLSAREVAFYLGVSVRSVWRWSRAGLLAPPVHIGRRVTRWSPDAVRGLVESLGANG